MGFEIFNKGKAAKRLKLDKDGKILDDDELYCLLDEFYDNNEYEKIVAAVTEISREQWSVKLHLRLISAYNNLRQFDNSRQELEKLAPNCKTPAEQAKFYYMHGYIYYAQRKEMMAITFYNKGIAQDPDNTSGYDLDKEVETCRKRIEKDLKELGELSEHIYNDIKQVCSEKPESEKADITDEEFTMYLGFLSAIRKVPGMERGVGFKDYFRKYEGADKEAVLKFLSMLGITDRESMLNFYQRDIRCNLAGMYNDIPLYLAGKPRFELSELNEDGRGAFLDAAEFFKPFNKYLPPAGIMAWDICEKVGFARLAYSCDIITNSDYCTIMMYADDTAREYFSSFEEYLLSLAFGCGVIAFHIDDSIVGAMKYMRDMMPLLLHGDLPVIKWSKK